MISSDLTISISKEYNTSLENLFNAWTQPEQLKQWWKPMNKNLREVVNDLREEGMIRYVFEDDSLIIEGRYIEIIDKEKLVYTWNWQMPKDDIKDSSYELTVEFLKKDNASAISIIQENLENEEGAMVHKQGWEKGLNDLKNYLESKG